MRSLRRSQAALAGIALLATACQGDLPTLEAPDAPQAWSGCSNQPLWMTLTPSSLLLPVGDSAAIYAFMYDTTGCQTWEPMWWASTDSSTVGLFGSTHSALVWGVAPGSAVIHARSWHTHATANVTVYQPVLTSIAISPTSSTILVGGTQTFTATGYDQHGRVCSNFCGAPAPTWSVDHSNIASISSSGTATGLAVGSTTVRATSGSIAGSASLNVEEENPFQCPPAPEPCYVDPY